MNLDGPETPQEAPAPLAQRVKKTVIAVSLLLMTALLFSYLLAYAMTDALATAKVMQRWTAEADPRPMWMIRAFVVLTATFGAICGLARFLSRRQLRTIDSLANE